MKYEIWITDKAGIPTFIKEYPYKIQCWTWALMNGYITNHRHWYFKDERLEIRKVRGRMKDTIIFILVSIFGFITFISVIFSIFIAADCKTQYAENVVILEELCSIKPDYHYCKRIKGASR